MFRYLNLITATLILGLASVNAYASASGGWYPGKYACEYLGLLCDIGDGGGSAVPELSIATGPVAVAVILGVVAIGMERRRHNNKK